MTGVTVDFNANLARFTGAVDKAISDLDRFKSKAVTNGLDVKKVLGDLGLGLSIVGFSALIKNSIDAQDHLNDLSKTTKLSVETLSGLASASKKSGSDLDSTASAIDKLAKNMGANAEKYKAIGVNAKDPLKAFEQIADVLDSIEDPQKRAAVAATALGKSWEGSAPLLAEGGARIEELIEKGSRLSGVTQQSADRADEFNDNLVDLNTTFQALVTKSIGPALPLMAEIVKSLADVGEESKGTAEDINILTAFFQTIAVVGANVSYVLKQTGNEIGGIAAQIAALFDMTTRGPAEAFKNFSAISDAMKADAEKARKELDEFEKRIMSPITIDPKVAPKQGKKKSLSAAVVDAFIDPAATEALKRAQEAAMKIVRDLDQEFSRENSAFMRSLEVMPESMRKMADDLDKVAERAQKASEATNTLFAQGHLGPEVYHETLRKITEEEEHQVETVKALYARQQELNASWEHGAAVALQAYLDEVHDVASQVEQLMSNAFRGMEDALVEFTKTGKLNFHSLAESIIEDLIRIQIRQSITGPLAQFGMDALGSLFGSPAGSSGAGVFNGVKLPSFAVGTDYVPRDMIAQIHKGERIVPAAQNATGMGGVSVSVSVDASGSSVQSDNAQAAELGRRIAGVVRGVLVQEKMPGGILA